MFKPVKANLFLITCLLVILASSACQLSAVLPSKPTPTSPVSAAGACEYQTEPTDQDIRYALNFPKGVFQSPEWERTYSVGDMRTAVTWTNDDGGLAYLEHILWSCGYSQQEIDEYFSDETLTGVILQYYDDVRQTAVCSRSRDLKLHEFSAAFEGTPYLMRLWIKQVSSTRVLYMLMAFPEDQEWALDKYSQVVFPSLKAC